MTTSSEVIDFPFTAVLGQAQFKQALVLCAVNPSIGGVLIAGPRGCAKSTLSRALADILPADADNHAPFVTLPLGASEEMLLGSLDLEQVLNERRVNFKPGLLSRAHLGVLYVDEVNLLPDHLVDQLLDVAASGVNRVERDGVSHQHAARFTLIGTMNPEEGELRAQLLDRFGLMVELGNDLTLEQRVNIVKSREAFERDPEGFIADYAEQQQQLVDAIRSARAELANIVCPDEALYDIAKRCQEACVDGLRGDIVMQRAAIAHAALRGAGQVTVEDIDAVADLVLAHRRQQSPQTPPPNSPPPFQRPPEPPKQQPNPPQESAGQGDWGGMSGPTERQATQRSSLEMPTFVTSVAASSQQGTGDGRGVSGNKLSTEKGNSPNWFATLQSCKGVWPPAKLQFKRKRQGDSAVHLVLLDTSASTLSGQLSALAKGVVAQIGEQAYKAREQLAILGFGGSEVVSLLPQTKAPKQLLELLDSVEAGGGTPLKEVLEQASRYLNKLLKQGVANSRCYLITDGRSRADVSGIKLPGEVLVIDTEMAQVKRGRAPQLADQLSAGYLAIS